MTSLLEHEHNVVKSHALNESLNHLLKPLQDAERSYSLVSSLDGADDRSEQDCQKAVALLLSTLIDTEAALFLQSRISNRDIASELFSLSVRVRKGNFSYNYYRPLVKLVIQRNPKASDYDIWSAVLDLISTDLSTTPPPRPIASFQQTPFVHNTSSFANSTEYRKHVDTIFKEELGHFDADVANFFEAYFGNVAGLDSTAQAVLDKCKEGNNPLYNEERGWKGWPEIAVEKDVLKWLADIIGNFVQFAEVYDATRRIYRRPLARPSQPLEGSGAKRKLDIGFVDDQNATIASKCHWSQIIVPGELKSDQKYDRPSSAWLDLGRYAREVLAAQDSRRFVLGFTLCGPCLRLWVFDRLGGIASESFDINKEGLQFVSVVLGFLLMSREQLGFDPTIITCETERYIEIEKDGKKEKLMIDEVIGRARCIAGRATTCWKVHREDKPQIPLVVKDSWQYPERNEEGVLLREATGREVTNVARYYHHETVCVNGEPDDILSIRRGLHIPTTSQKKTRSNPSSSWSRSRRAGKNSGSAAGKKRSSDSVDTALPPPPSKRTQSSSPTKLTADDKPPNRVHRRVVVCDYGKPIFESSSRAALLVGMQGCIKGYMSLYQKAGLVQSDISPRNLLVNEDDGNPSWRSFLIDLDLAISAERDGFSGARGKTGTRAFMAIGVLYGEKHSFMHDLESFFWVLFWVCIHYDGAGKGRVVEQFEKWNYMDTEELAHSKKGIVADEADFLRIARDNFTLFYQSLTRCVNRLRRLVFPDGGRWKKSNSDLPRHMIEELERAREDPGVVDN